MFCPPLITDKTDANSAAIFRLCVDMIEKPNGEIAVLEIGAFPSSSFSGHDRHQLKWTKRQEAMRDLMQFANRYNLPVFLIGSESLLDENNLTTAKEEAGLFWEGHHVQQQFYPLGKIDDLMTHIHNLPAKQFNSKDAATYRCIVISLLHIQLDLGDAIGAMHGVDELEELRLLPDVMLVDDKKDVYYKEIFDSKVITSALLPAEFAPKTLILPRKYEPDLANKIIAHFKPATKILIKPAHGTRGLGIIILTLENEKVVDQQLRDLLDPEAVYQKHRYALSQLNINIENNAEHYWMDRYYYEEPTIILQEFIASKLIVVNEQAHQAVTRFVFTAIINNGHIDILFHGNPYQKIASAPVNAPDATAASISRVHEKNGPEPIIMSDLSRISSIENQLKECFLRFFQTALKYQSKQQILADFCISDNLGYQAYGALIGLLTSDVNAEMIERIKSVLIKQPDLITIFFSIASTKRSLNDASSLLYLLTLELLQTHLQKAIDAELIKKYVKLDYYRLLSKILLPKIDILWQHAIPEQKYRLFTLLIECTDFIQDDYIKIDFPSIDSRLSILSKLNELIYGADTEIALASLSWCITNEKSFSCNDSHLSCTKHPLHSAISKILDECEQNTLLNPLLKSYILLMRKFGGFRNAANIIAHLKISMNDALDQLIQYAIPITTAFRLGVGTKIMREQIYEMYVVIFCFVRDIFKQNPAIIINNPKALGIFLCTSWSQQKDLQWFYQSVAIEHLWQNFATTQQAINAVWNLAFNTLLVTTDDDTGIERSLYFIEKVLLKNRLLVSNLQTDLMNYKQIYDYLLTVKEKPLATKLLAYFDGKSLLEVEEAERLAEQKAREKSLLQCYHKKIAEALNTTISNIINNPHIFADAILHCMADDDAYHSMDRNHPLIKEDFFEIKYDILYVTYTKLTAAQRVDLLRYCQTIFIDSYLELKIDYKNSHTILSFNMRNFNYTGLSCVSQIHQSRYLAIQAAQCFNTDIDQIIYSTRLQIEILKFAVASGEIKSINPADVPLAEPCSANMKFKSSASIKYSWLNVIYNTLSETQTQEIEAFYKKFLGKKAVVRKQSDNGNYYILSFKYESVMNKLLPTIAQKIVEQAAFAKSATVLTGQSLFSTSYAMVSRSEVNGVPSNQALLSPFTVEPVAAENHAHDSSTSNSTFAIL